MLKFRGDEKEFEKYYGDRKYKTFILQIEKKNFNSYQRLNMLKDIQTFINENDYTMYHDLMDDICESNQDWFNLLSFNKNERRCILEYIKFRVRSKNN